ncbi:hypothetical protein [uncultured Dialister sp.]|uniref:hypothetical protein n=1 Tax=Dialister succinatiphilus TaxID=487173 RepID=UPI0026709116|nr:hypothetical protein [uncultured Dialister sp.]
MISNEQEKREAVKAIKTLNDVLALEIVGRNPLNEGRINKVRSDIRAELGAYLARKELGEEKE